MRRFGMNLLKHIASLILALVVLVFASACAAAPQTTPGSAGSAGSAAAQEPGELYILFTSDVHCGVDEGLGYVGLQQIREQLEAKGCETILVDDGDSIQGASIGTMSRGEAIIELMNDLHYDVAIPGNHEFDFTADRFMELTEQAEYPYISCNLTKNDETLLPPYTIIERGGHRIAFVGVTTPETLITSMPTNFQDEDGNTVYGFTRDETGQALYDAVQKAVDDARAEGVDYVYLIAHLGLLATSEPWTYADVIENTRGIDVVLDGHSHDTDVIVMKNADGEDVTRAACGTKLNCIGYSHIIPGEGIDETALWSWPNETSLPELLGVENAMSKPIQAALDKLEEQLSVHVAQADADLTIFDPVATDSSGNPVRMVRRAETNLADLIVDAYRDQSGADVAITNGGSVRTSIPAGEITYGNIMETQPFNNTLCVIEASGQQILDALEWGARNVPDEEGGFLQVSGMSYTIDPNVESPCTTDKDGLFSGVEGARRVKDVRIDDEPIDPKKSYTVAGVDFLLLQHGDGHTAFDGAKVVQQGLMLDHEALINYVEKTLDGKVGEAYADPYGQDRITIVK